MREVDQLDDAVDHRVAEGDERVNRAVGHTEYQDLEEVPAPAIEDPREKHEDHIDDHEEDSDAQDASDGCRDERGTCLPQRADHIPPNAKGVAVPPPSAHGVC